MNTLKHFSLSNSLVLKRILLLCIFFFTTGISAVAQDFIIKGRIMDNHTEEPIPFTNIYLKGTTIGTVSDIDGNYTLQTKTLADSIGVSAIGYAKQFKSLRNVPEQTISFRVLREDVLMEEFVVEAGENPADIILRKIIDNKDSYNIEKLDAFQYEVYNKLELDIFDISEDFKNRKLFKPFAFIFDNIDTLSEEKPFLPMFLTETLSDYHYQKQPKITKEIIKASKISGVENESVTQFLGNMYQRIDIYENFMPVMGKNFPSPISNQGFFYYKYLLVDSATIDGRWSYHINFKPRRKQDNAFVGDFWVCDSLFALQRISMQLDAKEVNINFVDKLSVYQEFKPQEEDVWAIVKDKLIISFLSGNDNRKRQSPGIIGRKSTYYKDFLFNDERTKTLLLNKEDIEVAEDVFNNDEEFWRKSRHDSLTANEKAVYALVDTIKQVPIARTYASIVSLLVSGYRNFGPIDIGQLHNLFSSNVVEGFRLRAAIRTSNQFSKVFKLKAYGAYGFKDKKFKYGGSILTMLSKKPRQTLGITYSEDLDIQSQSKEEFGEDNILAGLYRRKVPQKIMRIQNTEIEYQRDWKLGVSNSLAIQNRQLTPYFDFYYFDDQDLASEPDSSVTTTEIRFNTRVAYKEKFVTGEFERTSLGTSYPIFNLTYTLGVPGILGSDFNYHKLEVSLYDWFYLSFMGYTEYNLTMGKVFGQLPFLLMEVHPGNETYFVNTYSFNMMNEYEFVSDTYASLFLTHHFEGLFFNRIPGIRKLKLRSLVSGKIAIGSISDENKAANTDPTGQYINFNKENQEFELPNWTLQTPTLKKPYVEVGVGIENILKFFRIEAIWRLTYTDTPSRVGIRGGMQLKF